MRYAFQALYIFLDSGTWADPLNPRLQPQQANEFTRTQRDFFGCGPTCLCDRVSEKILDNAYYHNSEYNANVSFFGYYDRGYGHGPVGWFPSEPQWTSELLWSTANIPQLADIIRENFGMVDEIVVNSGQWHIDVFEANVSYAVEQLRDLGPLIRNGKTPIWKTSCVNYGHPFPDKEFGTQAAQQLGYRVFDRKALTRALKRDQEALGYAHGELGFVDDVHLQPYVNAEMNNLLLNFICA